MTDPFPKLTWDKKQLVVGSYRGAAVIHQHHIAEASFKLTLELSREIGFAFYPGFFEAVEQDNSFSMQGPGWRCWSKLVC